MICGLHPPIELAVWRWLKNYLETRWLHPMEEDNPGEFNGRGKAWWFMEVWDFKRWNYGLFVRAFAEPEGLTSGRTVPA